MGNGCVYGLIWERRTPQVFRVHKTDHTLLLIYMFVKGRRGRGRTVVGFTTTYAINVNHH
jgi:hypothetical protein